MADAARLFISVDIPVTDTMRGLLSDLRGMRNVRASPEGQIHITLSFLGDTDVSAVPRLVKGLHDALSGIDSFDMSLRGVGGFPNLNRPRVIWVGIDEGKDELAHVADLVRGAVRDARLCQDDKPFSPHVTAARVQGPCGVVAVAERYKDALFCECHVDSVRLMKSVLGLNGAKHTVLERFQLG